MIFRHIPARALAVPIIALLATTAAAECRLEIERVDSVRIDGANAYDVFASRDASERATVRVRRVDRPPSPDDDGEGDADVADLVSVPSGASDPCRVRLRIGGLAGNTLRQGGSGLRYTLVDAGGLEGRPGATIDREIARLAPGRTLEHEFRLLVPAGQFVPHGTYLGELLVEVAPLETAIDGVWSGETEAGGDRAIVPVSVEVGASARLSFVGTVGSRRTVSFGELELGARPSVPVALLVQASSPYSLRFRSENGGRLRHETRDGESYVDYGLSVGDREIALADGALAALGGDHTSAGGERVPLAFRIVEDTRRKPAGTYTDRLTVEVHPGGFSPR